MEAALSQSVRCRRTHAPIDLALLLILGSMLIGCLTACGGGTGGSGGGSEQQPTLTLSPASISLTAGGSGQQTSLLLTAGSGTGATTVAVSGLPAGVTMNPATPSLTPGAALTITFTAASSAAGSTATVLFTAPVNGQTVSAQASLSVTAAAPPADFSFTATPAAVSLTSGGAPATVSLLASPLNGFAANVQVAVAGLPAGVTAQPSPVTLTPGKAATLTLTAPQGTAAGSSTATLTATSGTLTHTATVIVTVVAAAPQPDFSFTAMPAAVSLTSGGTAATVSLLASPLNGFAANVQVAVAGLPAGVTAQPAPVTLAPGKAATLTLAAPQGTAAGSSTATLTATSGALTHTATVIVTVVAAAPQPDFSLAVTPASVSLTVGGAGQPVQLTATALDGFTGTVNIALSTLPAGVTASPATLSLAPGSPQSVTLTAGNSAQAGSASVVFTGTSGSLSHTATLALTVAAAGANVTTYHNDNARDGWYSAETTLTPQNVNASTFGKLRELPVDGKVDAQPLVVSGLSIAGQTHDVVIVVTEHGSAYAFDADSGTQLWNATSLESGETTSDDHGCSQISPEIGITDTPVIDRGSGANGTVFFVAMSKDASGNYHQRLHALDLATGAEQPGSPSEIQGSFPGAGYGSSNGLQVFDPGQYAERVGLLLMNGQIYMAWTSHCDDDPYTGWLMAYSESTLQQTGVLNLTPNGPSTPHYGDGEGSVWMAGAGLAGDSQGNIFFLDANGTFDSTLNANGFPAQGDFGNSFMKVSTTGNVLAAADYFAAYNLQAESDADQDLGSGGAMLLPDLTDGQGGTRHLAVGAGKDTNIYIVDRDNMGKFNASSNNAVYQELPNALGGGAFSSPALLNNTVYYAGVGDYLKAFPINNALLATSPAAESANTFAYPGSTPSTSSNGSQNGIVWAVENQNGAGVLHAYDPSHLGTELYDSNQAANSRDHFTDNKYITPVIANGKVFVGTQSSVAVFGLLN